MTPYKLVLQKWRKKKNFIKKKKTYQIPIPTLFFKKINFFFSFFEKIDYLKNKSISG